jgi:hypothetical protein
VEPIFIVFLSVHSTVYFSGINTFPSVAKGYTGTLSRLNYRSFSLSGVPRNFVVGAQQIQLRTEGRENGDLGAVAPQSGVPLNLQPGSTLSNFGVSRVVTDVFSTEL